MEFGGAFDLELLDQRPGFLTFRAAGADAARVFQNESGGHRWQRVPPNERRGRVHTSTVTVAVLREPTEAEFRIAPEDLDWKTTRGSGPGGQNRNKVESCVVLTHVPTGVSVRCDSERNQHQNRAMALGILRARLLQRAESTAATAENADRRGQIGSGQRGDKRRTIALQRGTAVDHVTGQRWAVREYLAGNW